MPKPFEQMSIEQVARFPRPGAVIPGAIRFTPDSKQVLYLFSGEGSLVRSLWSYDIASGERRELIAPADAAAAGERLSREEQLRRERARLRETGVTDYRIAKDARPLTFIAPIAGKVYLKRGDAPLREIAGADGAIDPWLSNDASKLAFVRGGELRIIDLATREAKQLTSGAEPGLTHGLAGFIDQEELDRSRGFWWSPDGSHIAYQRNDERHIPVYPIVHQGLDRPEIEEHRYPFAGAANARATLCVVDVASGESRLLDLGAGEDVYLARVLWAPDSRLVVQVLDRPQRSARWLAFDREIWTPRLLLEEHQEPWLNLDHDTRFLKTGDLLRTSEQSGYRHLYLHPREGGAARQLTSGEWVITSVVSVDEPRRTAFVSATRESALERHLYAVSLDGGEPLRLTSEPGWHSTVVSPDGSAFVDVHGTRDHAPTATLRRRNGSSIAVLFENAGNDAGSLGLVPPRLLTVAAADGTPMDAAVYEPAHREAGRRYPVVLSVYGGPHAQRVADDWSLTVDLRAQYIAQQGFVVVKLDNRGSANRGLAFEAHLAGRVGQVEVDDQVAGLRGLSDALGYLDLERTGVYGWSYGGYMTLMCMLKAPELFKVGVAGAPVSDWDGYDTGYTERYIGTPESNPDGYRASSVLPLADRLEGKLLIVHGMIDENVHFRHTARLMKKLAEAQKAFDTLLYPEERHMPREAKALEHEERTVIGYLTRYL